VDCSLTLCLSGLRNSYFYSSLSKYIHTTITIFTKLYKYKKARLFCAFLTLCPREQSRAHLSASDGTHFEVICRTCFNLTVNLLPEGEFLQGIEGRSLDREAAPFFYVEPPNSSLKENSSLYVQCLRIVLVMKSRDQKTALAPLTSRCTADT
jgi:hypothetical protein